MVKQPSQATLLLVTWKRDPAAAVGFPAHFEASLAAQLFKRIPFDPATDAILTFYKAQRDLVRRQLPTGSPCQIIDSSQGFVVEGFAVRANKLSILLYHRLTLQDCTKITFDSGRRCIYLYIMYTYRFDNLGFLRGTCLVL
mgnify:CR=1 FL=1